MPARLTVISPEGVETDSTLLAEAAKFNARFDSLGRARVCVARVARVAQPWRRLLISDRLRKLE